MDFEVRYSQSTKVTNPKNQYENATFSVSIGYNLPFASPPEEVDEYTVWKKNLETRVAAEIQDIRVQVERELQSDVDKFYEDNS
jgi:hypothetical protein